jgi:hypothetical protein
MTRPSIFILEIRLLHTDPLIWRIVHMKKNMTLLDLHAAIQVAMCWEHTHHYEFIPDVRYPKQVIGVPNPETDAELGQKVVRSDEVKISEVFHQVGDKIRYVYDMGDNWEHDIELRGIVREDSIAHSPLCPSGYGACPPEDVGGIPGFRELLRAISNKDKDALKDYDAWFGKRFDPEGFQPPFSYSFQKEWKWVRKKESL